MTSFASLIAAATLSLSALAAGPALAAAPADLDLTAEPVVAPTESVEVAYYCDYILLWDAYGNYYYEYVCY